jgi:hypothetical protein
MSKLRIAPPRPDAPHPEAAPRERLDDLLNSTLCVDVEGHADLPGAITQAAKLARLLNLALTGLIYDQATSGSQDGDLELLQEVAYGIDHHARLAENLLHAKEPALPWRAGHRPAMGAK